MVVESSLRGDEGVWVGLGWGCRCDIVSVDVFSNEVQHSCLENVSSIPAPPFRQAPSQYPQAHISRPDFRSSQGRSIAKRRSPIGKRAPH